jgi:ribosomal-protein-alanine N-acetyltransferase
MGIRPHPLVSPPSPGYAAARGGGRPDRGSAREAVRDRRRAAIVLDDVRAGDLSRILTIENASFARPWSRAVFLQELRTPASRTLVARLAAPDASDGAVVGYLCRWLVAGEMHVLNLAVHPEWRHRGVARRLLRALIREARERGAPAIHLEVREKNLPARALYDAFGFTQVGRRRHYYGRGEDAVVMTRRLLVRTRGRGLGGP